MKRTFVAETLMVILGAAVIICGCSQVDEATLREIAREEAMNAIDSYTRSFSPEKFGFGAAWEKEWSYAQGVKTGNMIFVAGQLAHGQKVDENGMPEFMMGSFVVLRVFKTPFSNGLMHSLNGDQLKVKLKLRLQLHYFL